MAKRKKEKKEATEWTPQDSSPSGLAILLKNVSFNLNKMGSPISNSLVKNIDNYKHILKKAYSNTVANFNDILSIESNLDNLLF